MYVNKIAKLLNLIIDNRIRYLLSIGAIFTYTVEKVKVNIIATVDTDKNIFYFHLKHLFLNFIFVRQYLTNLSISYFFYFFIKFTKYL